eukprot:6175938-Pleurochrysis_carterae.AAC.1
MRQGATKLIRSSPPRYRFASRAKRYCQRPASKAFAQSVLSDVVKVRSSTGSCFSTCHRTRTASRDSQRRADASLAQTVARASRRSGCLKMSNFDLLDRARIARFTTGCARAILLCILRPLQLKCTSRQ